MMKILKTNFTFKDDRGMLREVARGSWKQFNLLTRKKGETSGNHYHKKLSELHYFINGDCEVTITNVKTKESSTLRCKEDNIFVLEPYEHLHIKYLEDTSFVVLMDHEYDKNEVVTGLKEVP